MPMDLAKVISRAMRLKSQERGSCALMLIDASFPQWVIWIVIEFVVARFYGSLGGILFTSSVGVIYCGIPISLHLHLT